MHSLKQERTTIRKSFFNINKIKKLRKLRTVLGVAVGVLAVENLAARDSHFLDRGDDAVLVSPRADFEIELSRLSLGNSRFRVSESDEYYPGEAAKGGSADLSAARK